MANLPSSSAPDIEVPSRVRWKVGTLTYTSGGLALVFFWLLWGDFAWSIKERSVTFILQLLLRKFEASDLMVGVMIGSLPAVLNMVISPVISYRSDRYRSRWGRRIPFLAIPTPFIVLSIIGLAISPPLGRQIDAALGAHSPGINFVTLGCFAFFWMLFEVATVAANAVFNALINDVVPSEMLGRFQGLFRALSLIAGIIFNYWIFARAEVHYFSIFLGIGLLYGVGFTLMCLKVKEGNYPPPPQPEEHRSGLIEAVKTYCQECFSQSRYLWVFAATNLPMLAFIPVNIYSIYFAKSIGMSMATYGKCIAITYGISLCASYIVGWLADRFHPVRVGLVSITIYAAVLLLGFFFATDERTFAYVLIAHGVFAGTWLTGTASLGQRLYPKARFAQFASAQAVIYSIGTIVLTPLVGWFLDQTTQEYRYTLLIAAALAGLGVLSTVVLLKRLLATGGLAQGHLAE